MSDTLAPPRIATKGRAGFVMARPRYSSSLAIRNPAADTGTNRVTPTVEACARWAAPNASFTKTSQSAASARLMASSFFSSPAWNRQFSSMST